MVSLSVYAEMNPRGCLDPDMEDKTVGVCLHRVRFLEGAGRIFFCKSLDYTDKKKGMLTVACRPIFVSGELYGVRILFLFGAVDSIDYLRRLESQGRERLMCWSNIITGGEIKVVFAFGLRRNSKQSTDWFRYNTTPPVRRYRIFQI